MVYMQSARPRSRFLPLQESKPNMKREEKRRGLVISNDFQLARVLQMPSFLIHSHSSLTNQVSFNHLGVLDTSHWPAIAIASWEK